MLRRNHPRAIDPDPGLSDLQRSLSRIDLDGPPLLSWLTPSLREVTGADSAMIYTVASEDAGLEMGDVRIAGRGESRADQIGTRFRGMSRESGELWTFYNPRRVEAAQQNTLVAAGSARSIFEGELPAALRRTLPSRDVERRLAHYRHSGTWDVYQFWGVTEFSNTRSLLCDGGRLLAWAGVLHGEALAPRIVRGLRNLLPALRRRFLYDERLSGAVDKRLLSAVLDEIHGAAYVLDARRRVVAANHPGAERLSASREQAASLRTRDWHPQRTWIDLSMRGCPNHVLVVDRHPPRRGTVDVAALRSRFALTSRESEVLGQLADGGTNRAIATALCCGERTVETHIRRILAKTDCASRSELVALLWQSMSPS